MTLALSRQIPFRLKIGIAFTALALLAISAVGANAGSQAREALQRQAGSALHQFAREFASNLDRGMFERYREVRTLAALPSTIGKDITSDAWRTLLNSLQRSFVDYTWIGLADPSGNVVAATGGLLEGRDVGARPWFQAGLRGGFAGDVHDALLLAKLLPDAPQGEPLRLVDFAAPVLRDGATIAVLGAHLDWRWVERLRDHALRTTKPDEGVQLVIVSRVGQVLLGPTSTPIAYDGETPSMSDADLVQWTDGAHYLTSAVQTVGLGEYGGLGWTVLARQPQNIALAPALALERRIWGTGVIGALLFGGFGWWLAGWLTLPLRTVAREAGILAEGLSDQRALRENNEIVRLGSALSALLAQLRQREEALLETNATLEARVAERTALLTEANADLRSFSRNVSHDLRGPVGSVRQILQLSLPQLKATQGECDLIDLLQLAESECGRVLQLLDGLMRLAHVEQQPLERQAVSMTSLVEPVVEHLNSRCAKSTHPPEVVIGPLPNIVGDPVLLRQVWENLLGNAYKFSSRVPQARIEIGASVEGNQATFSVADNGPGFDPQAAGQLFEPFLRLHDTKEFPGTGIGLSIAKRVVHRHGGKIWARAQPGIGATFSFSLALDRDA